MNYEIFQFGLGNRYYSKLYEHWSIGAWEHSSCSFWVVLSMVFDSFFTCMYWSPLCYSLKWDPLAFQSSVSVQLVPVLCLVDSSHLCLPRLSASSPQIKEVSVWVAMLWLENALKAVNWGNLWAQLICFLPLRYDSSYCLIDLKCTCSDVIHSEVPPPPAMLTPGSRNAHAPVALICASEAPQGQWLRFIPQRVLSIQHSTWLSLSAK